MARASVVRIKHYLQCTTPRKQYFKAYGMSDKVCPFTLGFFLSISDLTVLFHTNSMTCYDVMT